MHTDRRTFLGAAAAAATAALGLESYAAAEPRTLKLGVIGVGWYGMVDAKAALEGRRRAEIAAICDVDSEHLPRRADELEKLQGKRPQTFKLYQELLDLKGLDAVIIATPPQWHALPFIAALEKGLDVYCEKPLAYDVARRPGDGRRGQETRRPHRADRLPTPAEQGVPAGARSSSPRARPDGSCRSTRRSTTRAGTLDPTPQEPPASLDWDLWCGPGPKIPYSPQVGHINWRLEKTSGHGHLVDWGIHLIDAARMILGLGMPKQITAAGGLYALKGKITTPDTLTVHFEFDRCPVVWRHRIWGAEEYTPEVNNGMFFYGEKATVFVTDNRWVVIPAASTSDRQEHKADGDAGTGPHGRLPRRRPLAQAAVVPDRRRLPLDRHRATGDDRLRDRLDRPLGRTDRADPRQPGRRRSC